MINKITAFFNRLTDRNWGWPYHLILAQNGVMILIKVGVSYHLSAILVFFTGLFYGWYQLRKGESDSRDFFEDWAAEIIGIFAGILFAWTL